MQETSIPAPENGAELFCTLEDVKPTQLRDVALGYMVAAVLHFA